MARYVSRRSRSDMECDGWDEPRLYDSLTVIEREPSATGLLDASGNEIWRLPDPMGFRITE